MKFKITVNLVVILTAIFLSSCTSTKTEPTQPSSDGTCYLTVMARGEYDELSVSSFSKSKKLLLKLYKVHPVTLYCGCSFKGKKPNLSSCGYIPKKNKKRANRIEWEHVVPAHAFGQSFPEWKNGHPKCVSKKGIIRDESVHKR